MPRRYTRARLAATLVAAAGLASAAGWADVILMKNGDRITGDVKRVWDNQLFVAPGYADEFPVHLDEVASITSERTFDIELHDHSELVGTPTTDSRGNPILLVAGEARPFPVTDIEELTEPATYFEWGVRSDLAANVSRGNSDNTDWRWQSHGQVKKGDHRHSLDVSFERQSKDGDTTKEQDDVAYSYNWDFTDDYFLIGQLDWQRDPQRDLDRRWVLGGGLGYRIWDDSFRHFQVGITGDAIFEKLGGESDSSFAPRWSLQLSHDLLGGDLEFFHNHNIWVYAVGRSNSVFETSTGVRYDITDDIYANVQLDFDYETHPAAGAEHKDVTYLVGMGVKLD